MDFQLIILSCLFGMIWVQIRLQIKIIWMYFQFRCPSFTFHGKNLCCCSTITLLKFWWHGLILICGLINYLSYSHNSYFIFVFCVNSSLFSFHLIMNKYALFTFQVYLKKWESNHKFSALVNIKVPETNLHVKACQKKFVRCWLHCSIIFMEIGWIQFL